MQWRLIKQQAYSAPMNMAIDHAISESVGKGEQLPTVRFYTWNPSAVSIGCFQSLHDEVDIAACKKAGVDIVRRRTGGGAVFHDSAGEITYSVIAPLSEFDGMGITESYKIICGWVVNGLAELGIKGEFHPINDILVDGKKISGNAQTRRGGVLLQHGTVLLDADVDLMFSLLRVKDIKIRDKLIKNVKERITKIADFGKFSREEVYTALVAGLTQGKEYQEGKVTAEEMAFALKVKKIIYENDSWNGSR